MQSLLKSQKQISEHDYSGMSYQAIVIAQLNFFFQFQIMFHHLEKYLDIPALTINLYNFFGSQFYVGRKNSQPAAFLPMTNKNDLYRQTIFGFNQHAGQYFCFTGFLFYPSINLTKSHINILVPIQIVRHVFEHADHWSMLMQSLDDSGEGKPTVHEDIGRIDPSCQNSLYHRLNLFRCLGHCLLTSLVTAGSSVHVLGDSLHSVLFFLRRKQNKIQGQETHPIRPANGQHLEPFKVPFIAVVKDPRQQFDKFRMRSVIGAVIYNKYLLPVFVGQQIKYTHNSGCQEKEQSAPVISWPFQQIIGRILLEFLPLASDYAAEKVVALEWQNKDGFQQHNRRYTPHFPDASLVQQRADSEIVKERINLAVQSYCFLLFFVLCASFHSRPFSLFLLSFFAETHYNKKRRAFHYKYEYYQMVNILY